MKSSFTKTMTTILAAAFVMLTALMATPVMAAEIDNTKGSAPISEVQNVSAGKAAVSSETKDKIPAPAIETSVQAKTPTSVSRFFRAAVKSRWHIGSGKAACTASAGTFLMSASAIVGLISTLAAVAIKECFRM